MREKSYKKIKIVPGQIYEDHAAIGHQVILITSVDPDLAPDQCKEIFSPNSMPHVFYRCKNSFTGRWGDEEFIFKGELQMMIEAGEFRLQANGIERAKRVINEEESNNS